MLFWHQPVVRSAVDLIRADYGRLTPDKEAAEGCPLHTSRQYLMCNLEPASRSRYRRCQPGTGRGTLSRRAQAWHCWGMGHTGRGQTCPRTPSGLSSDVCAWSQRMARSSPGPRWATPGRELLSQPKQQGPHWGSQSIVKELEPTYEAVSHRNHGCFKGAQQCYVCYPVHIDIYI